MADISNASHLLEFPIAVGITLSTSVVKMQCNLSCLLNKSSASSHTVYCIYDYSAAVQGIYITDCAE